MAKDRFSGDAVGSALIHERTLTIDRNVPIETELAAIVTIHQHTGDVAETRSIAETYLGLSLDELAAARRRG